MSPPPTKPGHATAVARRATSSQWARYAGRIANLVPADMLAIYDDAQFGYSGFLAVAQIKAIHRRGHRNGLEQSPVRLGAPRNLSYMLSFRRARGNFPLQAIGFLPVLGHVQLSEFLALHQCVLLPSEVRHWLEEAVLQQVASVFLIWVML